MTRRGRPVMHTEPWAKVTVVMIDRHIAYLDRLGIDIRLKTGKAISRAEIIRGIIEGVFAAGVKLDNCETVEQIAETVQKELQP